MMLWARCRIVVISLGLAVGWTGLSGGQDKVQQVPPLTPPQPSTDYPGTKKPPAKGDSPKKSTKKHKRTPTKAAPTPSAREK